MTYAKTWEDFERAADKLYHQDPMRARFTMNYSHSEAMLKIKMTDDIICLQYKTELVQDMKKVEKYLNKLTQLMVSKET